jgi:hypothetical protein
MLACARPRGGLLLGVSHALHPGELTEEGLVKDESWQSGAVPHPVAPGPDRLCCRER